MVHLSKYCQGSATPDATSPKSKKKLNIDTTANGANNNYSPEVIIHKALAADAALRKYALHYYSSQPISSTKNSSTTTLGHRLPSLSILAESAFVNPLTAIPASNAVLWAEKMILEYMDGRMEDISASSATNNKNSAGHNDVFCEYDMNIIIPSVQERDAQIIREAVIAAWAAEGASSGRTPTNCTSPKKFNIGDWPVDTAHQLPAPGLSALLSSLHSLQRGLDPNKEKDSERKTPTGQPCGYVFRRGDIAWNCRTCQTDATCVICDNCFRNSDHEGHDVFFHRTTPGGCCDCGDREAWKVEGCCATHRPIETMEFCKVIEEGVENDDYEAVRAAKRSRMEHCRQLNGVPQRAPEATREASALPPRLAAAMGVVIGSAIKAIENACKGSAEGTDVSQWRLSLADEICHIWNGVCHDEDYYRRGAILEKARADMQKQNNDLWTVPENLLDASNENYTLELPKGYDIHLRLHNDDVHTFEEVIKALNQPSQNPNAVPIGGAGSIGKIGGKGLRGDEYRSLSNESLVTKNGFSGPATKTSCDDNVTMTDAASPEPTNINPIRPRPERTTRGYTTHRHPEVDPISPLVPRTDEATDLTKKVDSEGQVIVRNYETLDGAGVGFARLRESAGLHCSVISGPRIEAEKRAKVLLEWLVGLVSAHPAVGAMIVQGLVDVTDGEDVLCADDNNDVGGVTRGVAVWNSARMMPCWSGTNEKWCAESKKPSAAWKKRLEAFPPHLESSYLTREEGRELFRQGLSSSYADKFVTETATNPDFYANIPYSLPDSRLLKSPHALWGTLPTTHLFDNKDFISHPLLRRLTTAASMNDSNNDAKVCLRPRVFVVDTDLRKHEESEILTCSLYPHRLSGLNLVSGISCVDENGSLGIRYGEQMGLISQEYAKSLISCSSFLAPVSSVLLMLLLDPYSPKLVRSSLQRLFLSLLTDGRFKSRFAASLGALVYRPTSTLFCAGIGTDADTLLGFTVQLFTTGSLMKALGNLDATRTLLCREDINDDQENAFISALPIAYSVVRSIHANILGSTDEVSNFVENSMLENENNGSKNDKLSATLALLSYQLGSEHPLNTRLPAAPDDKFIDSRCMKHKRLQHLLRDLEYIFETPGTAVKLLTSIRASNPPTSPDNAGDTLTPSPSFSYPTSTSNSLTTYSVPNPVDFPSMWARLLRLGQGIDLQKRRISGGHVEYEDQRWLDAFSLSITIGGTSDALSESPFSTLSSDTVDQTLSESMRYNNREAMGNLFGAFFREIKMWLYREGMLETGQNRYSPRLIGELEALQRSTLHVSVSQLDESCVKQISAATGIIVADSCDVACESAVKNLPEAKLALLEAALLYERLRLSNIAMEHGNSSHGPLMGDWLKVPNSPLTGDALSFHLPLHRSLARSIRCFCSAIVPTNERETNPNTWWRLPLLDDDDDFASPDDGTILKQDCLSALLRPTHRSSNLRVVWSAGPDCTTQEAQSRRSRARLISSALASTKVVHSLCDHPLRCIAASLQIEHHMWAKNGSSLAGMALNYASVPLCRLLKDLDLTMVQLSACGFNVGLGARRVFALLINRFSLDGYLCDPDRHSRFGKREWVKPPRLRDVDHAELLAESFFATLCVLVTDLPPPPPSSYQDNEVMGNIIKRELLHALAVEPRSHSEAMAAASAAMSRRDDSDGGPFSVVFNEILGKIAQQRNQGARASGPPTFELKPEESNEYDPSFYHLRKTDHQQAMDNIARLRKQKLSALSGNSKFDMVLPLVAEPPKGHPRFLPSRLMLHLPTMYASIRRYLMYALFNGSWLPPDEPISNEVSILDSNEEDDDMPLNSLEANKRGSRDFRRAVSEASNISSTTNVKSGGTPLSPSTVAASSKSFLEVLQLLTLQAHTLEECGTLHKELAFLDHEQKSISASIDVESYLGQLIHVPTSLTNVWALLCSPDGPLPSQGSGENRGSVLGLCIALFEHRDADDNNGGGQKGVNDDHGGSRTLSADGMKWLLRFVSALADGAENASTARESATSGVRVQLSSNIHTENETRGKIKRMLANLPNLWPSDQDETASDDLSTSAHEKNKEARKAAQARVLAKMRKQQASFAASISSQFKDEPDKKIVDDSDENLCIICRCDDADGDNGPMGYLGHVQRSRVLQLESKTLYASGIDCKDLTLSNVYRVVGDKGCQLRSTEALDSAPVAFLPQGGFVEILQSKMSPRLNLQSRRVLVKQLSPHSEMEETIQGWASIQSKDGYIILSPLSSLCYSNTRWGSTRPVFRLCGHAAHLRCVEQHTLSLHQRAEVNQPYDGRFSANIQDGEFLCPLCKQLSNIVIPEDACIDASGSSTCPQSPTAMSEVKEGFEIVKSEMISSAPPADTTLIRNILTRQCSLITSENSSKTIEATRRFGSNLMQAMKLSREYSVLVEKQREKWHPALRRWDFEDKEESSVMPGTGQVGSCLRLMRQLLISWSAVGHSAAAAESSGRGVQQVVFGEVTYASIDPWTNFSTKTRDSHPMLIELRRTLSATSSLVDVVAHELGEQLADKETESRKEVMSVVGSLLSDILVGNNWTLNSTNGDIDKQWQLVTPLIASMLCHVSKEDTLAPKLEARSVAASMWAITGSQIMPQESSSSKMDVDSSFGGMEGIEGVEVDQVGYVGSQESDTIIAARSNDTHHAHPSPILPPKPLCVYRAEKNLSNELVSNWGTLSPFRLESHAKDGETKLPFRPAVASAFLYVPLLAWDLNTFAGALFSALLSNPGSEQGVSSFELIQSSKLLITARLVQILSTPDGFLRNKSEGEDEFDYFDDEDKCWDDSKIKSEASAINDLMLTCRKYIQNSKKPSQQVHELNDSSLIKNVGNAILPFARSLILLLRASTSIIRQRRRRVTSNRSSEETKADQIASSLIENSDNMTKEDGLKLLELFGAPLPSEITSQSSWNSLVGQWLKSLVAFESCHGTRGQGMVFDKSSNSWVRCERSHPSPAAKRAANGNGASPCHKKRDVSSFHNLHVDSSPGAVEVARLRIETHHQNQDSDDNMSHPADADEGMGFLSADDAFAASSDEELEHVDDMDIDLSDGIYVSNHSSPYVVDFDIEDDNSDTNAASEEHELYTKFAYVSESAIIPYQPSISGTQPVGPGPRGSGGDMFEYKIANRLMKDLSHLGMIHIPGSPMNCLIKLPKSFVELYSIVNRVKGREGGSDDNDDSGYETAICLLTGSVIKSGTSRKLKHGPPPPGMCTLHSRKVGSGIGIFFLVQKCTVLLMHNNKSAYSPSLYVDEHGEEDVGLRRGRPLFFSDERYQALETLWRTHGIPREVSQIRSTSDRVIRDNWY